MSIQQVFLYFIRLENSPPNCYPVLLMYFNGYIITLKSEPCLIIFIQVQAVLLLLGGREVPPSTPLSAQQNNRVCVACVRKNFYLVLKVG